MNCANCNNCTSGEINIDYKKIKHACFNLTNQCNLRCIYCFTAHNPRRMSLQVFKDAILFGLENFGLERATFFGGEPMLEFDSLIVPIVEWVEENQIPIKFGMTTNGTLFTDERLDWMKEHGIGFLLSIDGGVSSQNHNRPRVDGGTSFDLIQPFLPRIVKDFPHTTFRSTVTPFSAKNLVQDYLFARKMGFQTYYIVPDCLNSDWTPENLAYLYQGYATILEIMYRDILNNTAPLEISQFVKSVQTILPYKLGRIKNPIIPTVHRCGLGTVSLGFSPEGYISACQEHATYDGDTPFFIGDIYNGIDKEKHQNLLHMVNDYKEITNSNLDCKNCVNKKYCAGQYCPSHNYLNSNTLHIQDDLSCKWQIFQNEQAMILLDMAAKDNNNLFLAWITEILENNRYR